MIIRKKLPKALPLHAPLLHADHSRPVNRREFLAQGFISGAASVLATPLLASLLKPGVARADALTDLNDPGGAICNITLGAGKIPFLAFDLAGGGNIAGSNVLVGQQNGQGDFLTTAGYQLLGVNTASLPSSSTGNFIDTQFGLAFHSDSAYLRGMLMTTSPATRAKTMGAVIPAISQNDTANNYWGNTIYGIAKAGALGQLTCLVGSQTTASGGNSMASMQVINPAQTPVTVQRPQDATGLVNTGQLGTLLGNTNDTVSVMESVKRISDQKLTSVNTQMTNDAALKTQASCAYERAAYMAEQFSSPAVLDATKDANITSIFSSVGGIGADSNFGKTAAISKLVIQGFAGAGVIEMGGFDYHTGDRATGEARDFNLGICIGACLELANLYSKPLMIQVFSDGSLNSNGMVDNSVGGRGKGVWTGDNQTTACTFFLVFNPNGRATPVVPVKTLGGPQLGYFQPNGNVNSTGSPGANSVTTASDMILLNYLALHNQVGMFSTLFNTSPLNGTSLDSWTAFNPIVDGVISSPIT